MRGQYYPSTVTLSSNAVAMPGLDVNANLKVNVATMPGADQTNDRIKTYTPFSYVNITTNTTTLVKPSLGYISHITLNNPGKFTVADLVIVVYDNSVASSPIIGTWTIPVLATAQITPPIEIRAATTTAFTVVTSGPTVPANLSVYYL